MKLNDAVADFLMDSAAKGNSAYTLTYYECILKRFANFTGDIEVSAITVSMCKQYYFFLSDDGLTSGSVQTYIRGLRAFLHWLYENEIVNTNICHKFKLPKAYRKEMNILTDEEIAKLYLAFDSDFCGIRNLCMCSLMLDSGLRLLEVLSLEKSLLHLEDGYCIVNGKCQKQRTVPIGKTSAGLLRTYLEFVSAENIYSPYVFTAIDGEPLTRNTVKNIFRKLKKSSGISRIHPHLLRHTFATKYLENGGNIYALQSILGHTSLEMVKRYLHLSQSRVCADFGRFSPLDNLNDKAG